MRIAVDLDGVVFNSEMYFMAAGEWYDCKILGKNSIKKKDEPRVQDKYNWSQEELRGYIDRYANTTDFDVMPFARDIIDEMRRNNTVLVISARGQFNEDEITIARRKLDEAHIVFDEYYFSYLDKSAIARDQRIDVIIDDRYDVCEQLSKDGVLCLYFRMAGRKKLQENDLVCEVNNWGDVYRVLHDKGVIGNE